MQRQQGHARSECYISVARNVEPIDILPSNISIAANINNIYAIDFVPNFVNSFSYNTSGNEGFTETNFICNKKTIYLVAVFVQPSVNIIHRITLEVF